MLNVSATGPHNSRNKASEHNGRTLFDNGVVFGYCTDTGYLPLWDFLNVQITIKGGEVLVDKGTAK